MKTTIKTFKITTPLQNPELSDFFQFHLVKYAMNKILEVYGITNIFMTLMHISFSITTDKLDFIQKEIKTHMIYTKVSRAQTAVSRVGYRDNAAVSCSRQKLINY